MDIKLKRLTVALAAALTAVSAGAFTAFADEGDIDINQDNFPNKDFREYIASSKFDKDTNSVLSQDEIALITEINVSNKQITNLTGIEHFTALEKLNCSGNQLTELDLSSNTNLTYLDCRENQLTSLDLSKNTALTTLLCRKNKLTKLDLKNNAMLSGLDCSSNVIESIDLSGCTDLYELYCEENKLMELDVSSCKDLGGLNCYKNNLEKLDLSKNEAIITVACNGNQLTSLDLSSCTGLRGLACYDNQLTSLDISDCTSLVTLECYNNQLKKLDVGNCKDLKYLKCSTNSLGSLDVSKNASLLELDCSYNQIGSLDVSQSTALEELYCQFNALKSLDVSGHTDLRVLNGSCNQLTSLGVSGCSSLKKVTCYDNQLTSLDLSSCTFLNSATCGNQKLSIGDVDGSYPLPAGFDPERVSGLTGAEYDGTLNALVNFTSKTVTYSYDCGMEQTMDVTLNADSYRNQDEVYINEANFPDAEFRTYVRGFNTDGDNKLSKEELAAVDKIDVSYPTPQITDLKGIEYFTALTYLNCSGNQLTSLDVSRNTALTNLSCYSDQLKSLDVSKNTALKELHCGDNQLASLDVSKNTALTDLYCGDNKLTSLDLSRNTALETLNCYKNQLTSLDLSRNADLKYLWCGNNQLTSLDVSKNTALTDLGCFYNQLTSLDLSQNTALKSLDCSNNQHTSLELNKSAPLGSLSCNNNQLTSLDVSGFNDLVALYCNDNSLTSLDLSGCKSLRYINVSNQTCSMGNVDGSYPLAAGFDPSKVTDLTGAEYDGTLKALINFTSKTVTYNYDCGMEQTMNVTLTADSYRNQGDVYINEVNFPDPVFRKFVSDNYDKDGDNIITKDELAAVSEINVYNKEIADLSGIEYFTALEALNCNGNKLTSLDLSSNTALKDLRCGDNQLASLDVSRCADLTYLSCVENQLTKLDISNNAKLEELSCGNNQLASLDISKNTALTRLDCYNNKLTALDVSNNTKLEELNCDDNRIAELDVSKNTALKSLHCVTNQLTSLDVSGNTELTMLSCDENRIASLDVSRNTALTLLSCGSNQLTELDVSKNTALTILDCNNNQLTSLDVSKNTALNSFNCKDNKLTSLDLSNNTALKSTYLTGNSFDIGEVTKTYDLANLPAGFDISKASNWQGAVCESGVLTDFTANTITYTYDCGNGISETFTLTVNLKPEEPVPAFVERLYTTLLGRPSDEQGKADWVTDLKNGRPAADVASGFVLSEELRNQNLSNGEFVDRMYRTLLNREADGAGKAEWVSALDNGCSYGYILSSFAGSQEFINLCDSYGITAGSYVSTEPRDRNLDLTAFVSRMYTKALGRAYDADGLNGWTDDYLTGAATAEKIAYGFIFSPEFVNKELSNEQYVDTLYRTFFDREPDAEGRADWLSELANGASREYVLDGFLGAQEFANLKASFGV